MTRTKIPIRKAGSVKKRKGAPTPNDGRVSFTVRIGREARLDLKKKAWMHNLTLTKFSRQILEGFVTDPENYKRNILDPFASITPDESEVLQEVLALLRSDKRETIRIVRSIVENWRTVGD